MSKKPIIYFIFRRAEKADSPRFDGFARRLKESSQLPDAEYRTLAMNELIYTIDHRGEAAIYDANGEQVLHDADFVYFKSWERMPERAAAIAQYLQVRGVEFDDRIVLQMGTTKLSQLFRLWAANCPVIPSVVASELPSEALIGKILGEGPYLVKPLRGEKGARTQVADNFRTLRKIVSGFQGGWIVQTYLKNDGDYRIFVYGYTIRGAMKRQALPGEVVNNTTRGAAAIYYAPDELSPELKKIARRAAVATGNAVAGVDILPYGKMWYVLEVNQGSQVVTGKFTAKKKHAFGEYLHERLGENYRRQQRPNRLRLIGRTVYVSLPEFGRVTVHAKVDTGAYQSALHAADIREETRDGQKVLVFTLLGGHQAAKDTTPECVAHEYDMVRVVSSNGQSQVRYRIKTYVSIAGIRMKTHMTLTNRSDMTLPMLLGRQFLRGRYLVNVEMSRRETEEMI